VTLYLAQSQMAQFAPLAAKVPHLTLEEDRWAHWVASARGAGVDLRRTGRTGASSRAWQRWRWPVRIAVLALLVNVIGINIEWMRLKGEAKVVNQSMAQTFKSVYPKEPLITEPLAQWAAISASPRPIAARLAATNSSP
jgi:general secretion pathway protein L